MISVSKDARFVLVSVDEFAKEKKRKKKNDGDTWRKSRAVYTRSKWNYNSDIEASFSWFPRKKKKWKSGMVKKKEEKGISKVSK